jgi:ferredoxin
LGDSCRVLFLPDNRYIMVGKGESLLKAAMDADVHINASCGGAGSCGKCRVLIDEGEVERATCSPRRIGRRDFPPGS